jgi:hypothetical protein
MTVRVYWKRHVTNLLLLLGGAMVPFGNDPIWTMVDPARTEPTRAPPCRVKATTGDVVEGKQQQHQLQQPKPEPEPEPQCRRAAVPGRVA